MSLWTNKGLSGLPKWWYMQVCQHLLNALTSTFIARTRKVSYDMLAANAIQSHQLLHQWLATVAGGPHKGLAHNNGTHNNCTDHIGINHSGQPRWANHKCQPLLVAITSILQLKQMKLVLSATIALSTTVSQHAHCNCSTTLSAPTRLFLFCTDRKKKIKGHKSSI